MEEAVLEQPKEKALDDMDDTELAAKFAEYHSTKDQHEDAAKKAKEKMAEIEAILLPRWQNKGVRSGEPREGGLQYAKPLRVGAGALRGVFGGPGDQQEDPAFHGGLHQEAAGRLAAVPEGVRSLQAEGQKGIAMPRRIKFTQIAVCGDGANVPDIFALDEYGRVWERTSNGWYCIQNPQEKESFNG